MADWLDSYVFPGQIDLRDIAHLNHKGLLSGDVLAKILTDNTVKAAMDIAEDDRRAGWPIGSKPTRTSLNLERSQQCLYGKSFVRSLGSVRSSLRNLRIRIDRALRLRR